ncbi:MAG: penicillin-binding protein 2 [bacterium]|nr:penicillin-binding protein 2 [bacterium]
MHLFETKSIKNKNIKSQKNLSFDEAFLDAQVESLEPLDDERIRPNYLGISAIVLISVVVILARIFYLQGIKGEEFRDLAEGNKLRTEYVLAPRGLITDRFGNVITNNIPNFELVVIAPDLTLNSEDQLNGLKIVAEVLELSVDELQERFNMIDQTSSQPQILVSNVPKDKALVLISKQKEIAGFKIQDNPIRDYKDGEVFAHLVGYTGRITPDELAANQGQNYLINDYIGKTGIEIQYEDYLRGVAGKRQVEIDVLGEIKRNLGEISAKTGANVKLNIDAELQRVLYHSLVNGLSKTKSRKGAAVAQDPRTGEILALVSLPSFDTNLFARGISQDEYSELINDPSIPLLNRVVAGTYPPGSTIKPALGIAALTEGTVKPNTKILDDGVIRIGSFNYFGYNRQGLGLMDIYSAIARSSDIYFYTIGGGNPKSDVKGLGPEKLAEWYRKFNLGKLTGIDLPSEKQGLVPDPAWKLETRNERWFLGNTYHYSIGQGDLLVTPLQLNNLTASIANGGKIMQPYILNNIIDNQGNVLKINEPHILKEDFLDDDIVRIIKTAMRQTVTNGSGILLNSLPLEIAGKTGTSQFSTSQPGLTHAWFTSFAPASDPKIALTILAEAGGEGSTVAVPVARDVYRWWAENRAE